MLIRFKNKWTMQIISMISQGKKLGGLPSHIELSPEEATLIIDEINSLRKDKETQHQRYKFTTNGVDSRLMVLGRDLTKDEKLQLLADWTEGKLTITFDSVELRVIIVAKADAAYHN